MLNIPPTHYQIKYFTPLSVSIECWMEGRYANISKDMLQLFGSLILYSLYMPMTWN